LQIDYGDHWGAPYGDPDGCPLFAYVIGQRLMLSMGSSISTLYSINWPLPTTKVLYVVIIRATGGRLAIIVLAWAILGLLLFPITIVVCLIFLSGTILVGTGYLLY
jgi:hypothetical protein